MHIVMLETTVPRGFHHVETLADAGVEVSFVTEDLDAYARVPGFEAHRRAARVVSLPATRDVDGLAAQLAGKLGPNHVDGVLCVHDQHVVAANGLARELGVPHERPATIQLLRDKAEVRRRVSDAGLGSMRWRLVPDAAEAPTAAIAVGFPLVLKPLANYGSIGVAVVWTRNELEKQIEGVHGSLLLEQYMSGRHVSAEVLVQDGNPMVLGFAERLPAPPGVTAELGGHFPARFEGLGAARELLRDLVRVLGVRDTALHVEMMITAAGPELIEVNSRVAGHVVSEQITRSLGRKITLDLLDIAIGRPLAPLDEPVHALALCHVWTDRSGVVRSIRSPRLTAEVVRFEPVVSPGDRVRPLQHNFDRLGYVLTEALTAERAAAAAAAVIAETEFVIDADSEQSVPDQRFGHHALLVLDDAAPLRILDAAGTASRQVSVAWLGPRSQTEDVRRYWANRYAGQWLDAHSVALESAVKEMHAVDPVEAVVAFSPPIVEAAGSLRAALGMSPVAVPTDSSAVGRSETVVLLFSNGTESIPWAVVEDGRRIGHVAHQFDVWAYEVGALPGIVSCVVPEVGPVRMFGGVDDGIRALCDAVFDCDIVSTALSVAITGRLPSPPRRRDDSAVLRRIPAPSSAFRVADATPATSLYADPAVCYVNDLMPPGHLHRGGHDVDRMTIVVKGGDAVADRIEQSLRFRHTPQDRTHVLLVDRFGSGGWTRADGSAVLPSDRFRLTVIGARPAEKPSRGTGPDQFLHADVFDLNALVALTDAVHAAHPVDRIACGTEHLLASAAELRERVGAAGDSQGRVRAVRDKAEMKRLARIAGIPCSAGGVLGHSEDAITLLGEHGAIVVKPRDRSGAQGVQILRDRPALDRWLHTTFLPDAFLGEAYQSGPVCHIDAVLHQGVVAYEVSQYGEGALNFASGAPVTSWTVDDSRLRGHAVDLLNRVCDGWGIASGVLHLEAFDAGDHLVFNEVAGRAGGGGIPHAFPLTQGLDLRHAQLAIDAGDDPRRLLVEPVAVRAGWIVKYSPGGRLTTFDDSSMAGLWAHREVSAAVGDDVPVAAFRGTGLATYAFAANSTTQVRALLRRAEQGIRIEIDPVIERNDQT